jgi:lysophospholipase L1-like esterase
MGLKAVSGGGSGTGALTPSQVAASNNNTALLLPKFRTAIAKVKSGQANCKILCLGDSTTFGTGSNNSNVGNLKPLAYPTQLQAMMNSAGINSHSNSFMGYGSTSFENNGSGANDARIVMGSSWSGWINPAFGGTLFENTGSTTNSLAFTPTLPVDTFVITYLTATGNGTFSAGVNSGTPTNQNTNSGSGFATLTVTGTLGINTLNLKYVSGGTVFIQGVEAYDSSKKWADFVNAGWSGAQAGDIAGNVAFYSPIGGLEFFAPDLTLLNIGINDWNGSTTLANFQTNVQSVITACKLSGDVIIVSPAPTASSQTPSTTQQGFVTVLSNLANTNKVPFIDWWTRMGPQANNTAMYWTGNNVHPNMIGYSDNAQDIFNMIGNL